MDPLESMWRTYETVNEWIRLADAKATAVLGAEGVLAGVLFTDLLNQGTFAWYEWVLLGLFATSASVSIWCCLKCLSPTLAVGEPTSLVYFAHIAQRYQRPGDYATEAHKAWADGDTACSEIGNQIWANSRVAWGKYRRVTCAIRSFAVSVFSVVVWLLV